MEITNVNAVDNTAEENNAVETAETNEETKTYTQEEVVALLQKNGDRRVQQALAKQKKQYEKQISLSKLDGDEREKAEKDAKIQELEEKLSAFEQEKNRSELKSVLASRGLSAEFADIVLITNDLEESQANIDKLDKLFKAAVKAEVEKRLAGNTPKGNGAIPTELTREDAKKMSIQELNDLAVKQPELFAKLFN